MSHSEKVEVISRKAEALEKQYQWVKATDSYKQALDTVGKSNLLEKGEIQEKIGRCLHRAAFQAESHEGFKERMRQAIEAYEKAHGFYEKLADATTRARSHRCSAAAKYLGYWLTSDPSEKRKLLDECLELKGKALAACSKTGDMLEYARTYNELPHVFWLRVYLEWDRQTRQRIIESGLKWGEKAVAALSEHGDLHETARTYFTLSNCQAMFGWNFIAEPEKKNKSHSKVVKLLSQAVDLSEKIGDAFVLGMSHLWLGYLAGGEEAVRHFKRALACGKQTRDNYLIAWSLAELADAAYHKATATEDPEKRRELAERVIQLRERAECHRLIISLTSAEFFGNAELHWQLAIWETDPQKRREFLENAEKIGTEALKSAENSDMPDVISFVFHTVSKILESRALTEPDPAEKRGRLKKALKYREKTIEVYDRLYPFDNWGRGVMKNYLAGIKTQLASIEPDPNRKRRLLEEAVSSKEKCLKLCNKDMPYYERVGDIWYHSALQGYQDAYATLLTHLHDLTNRPEHLRKAIEILQKAIDSSSKLDMVSLTAESHWKIAKVQNTLGEYLKAAESFERASDNYMKAAEKIPQLKDFYQDYASYMQAWNEIKKAKHHHAEEQYDQAKEHYEKAADFHNSTKRWSHLSLNYSAWARLEEAEALSRKEQTEEARDLFQQAAKLFVDAGKSIKTRLEKIDAKDEKEMATELIKASDTRREYCLGRIALEEAKILDRQGDHRASSNKYGSAIVRYQKAGDAIERVSDRQELRPLIYLCQAWQKMKRAEAEASPDLYLEASQLFEEAKEHSFTENAKMLALGHSRFCKALEAGTRFEDTRDATVYSTAKGHIEAATNYYLKAGFKTASEYAKATYRLFDAYLYTYKAQTETDPRKKAQFYQMAEKLLQASAGSYMKAKHPEKSDEVQRLYESVKEERQLAISLAEVLHAPLITSTTTSFSTPSPIYEEAVGLERFEHAHVQANLFFQLGEVKVGENVALEIELVNAGKGPATLVKVDDIVPAGFDVIEKPEMYRVEDSYLNMKGKRLDPLQTEEAKIVYKPRSKGTFVVKPRILYINEIGEYKSQEPEPVTITVKELGLKGWIKGER